MLFYIKQYEVSEITNNNEELQRDNKELQKVITELESTVDQREKVYNILLINVAHICIVSTNISFVQILAYIWIYLLCLIFDTSLEINYNNIFMKASERTDICSLN